ncbi:MAG: hypothetical protein ACI8T1_000163 [Verrucomicrobiales bacterium]|jgi:hypothetical protein
MDAQVPVPGRAYLALGEVTPTVASATGTFAGDSLGLIGSGLTLRLEHQGAASANLSLTDLSVALVESNRLEGVLNVHGDVENETTFELAAQLQGAGSLHFSGADPEVVTSTILVSGSGSGFEGALSFENVNARGATAGSLGTGSIVITITIASGTLTIGYPLSSPVAILRLQGQNFQMELEGDVAVQDLIGISEEGDVLFSLLDVTGDSSPFTTEALREIFTIDEGISGEGTLTLLRDARDLDNDGLRDSWEVENFGDTASANPEDDGDADGLNNLAEQAAGTDPKGADTDGDTLTDGDEVAKYQSDPTLMDTDDDGIDDAEEVSRALNPGNADTDGDGLADGFERDTSMTDPGNADSDSDGFSDKAEIDNGADPLDSASQPNQFVVRTIASEGAEIASLAGDRAHRDGTILGIETVRLHSTINFTDNLDLLGLVPGDVLFDGDVVDQFIVHAVGKFKVPTAGPWGIGFHSDDGGQLIIDGTEIIEFDGVRGRNATMRTLTLTEGEHTLEVLMFERIGGAALEVFRAKDPGDWDEVGNGALPASFDPLAIVFERNDGPVTDDVPRIETVTRTAAGIQLGLQSDGPVDVEYSVNLEFWELIVEAGAQSVFVDGDPDRLVRPDGYLLSDSPQVNSFFPRSR